MKLKAMRTFEGNEGLIRRGDTFETESTERGEYLIKLELAEKVDPSEEVTNLQQKAASFDGMKKDDLIKYAEDNAITFDSSATKEELLQTIKTHTEKEYLFNQASGGASIGGAGTAAGAATGAGTGAAGAGTTGNTGQGGAAAAGGNTGGSATGAAGTGAAGGTV